MSGQHGRNPMGWLGHLAPPIRMTQQQLDDFFALPLDAALVPKEPAPTPEEVSAYHCAIAAKVPADTTTGGKKYDSGKPDYTLLPFKALEDIVKVLGFGAVKYGRNNWQSVERQRYIAAAFRHLVAIANGEEFDAESGMPHAAHLSCCSLFLGELGSK